MLKYRYDLKPLSRILRNNMTDAEEKLWFHIRRKQIFAKSQRNVTLPMFRDRKSPSVPLFQRGKCRAQSSINANDGDVQPPRTSGAVLTAMHFPLCKRGIEGDLRC